MYYYETVFLLLVSTVFTAPGCGVSKLFGHVHLKKVCVLILIVQYNFRVVISDYIRSKIHLSDCRARLYCTTDLPCTAVCLLFVLYCCSTCTAVCLLFVQHCWSSPVLQYPPVSTVLLFLLCCSAALLISLVLQYSTAAQPWTAVDSYSDLSHNDCNT